MKLSKPAEPRIRPLALAEFEDRNYVKARLYSGLIMVAVRTKPELFIIESLTLDDEKAERQEGDIISRMLQLAGKTGTRYYYIRTARELEEMIDLFDDSHYRYLHISCHADKSGMATTFDEVPYADLGEMLRPCLSNRRVFVSACQMASEGLAKELLPGSGCYSLIGPKKSIAFDNAAAFWVSFYHLMFKTNELKMTRGSLQRWITELSALYDEPINYFVASKRYKQGFRRVRNTTRTKNTE